MAYSGLYECICHQEKLGNVLRIKKEVDPYLEMSAIQLEAYRQKKGIIFFEKIKGSKFPAVSNLFGSAEISRQFFGEEFNRIPELIKVKQDPGFLLKKPFSKIGLAIKALNALPKKVSTQVSQVFDEISLSELPQIIHWPDDGGAFITLPQVYSEDPDQPGIMHSNLGMYRIQISGNDYKKNKEIGLHYQIHRGIGVHQTKAAKKNQPLKVSIFIGGPPSHTLSAVMPLPEGLSELTFAGALGGRRFRYRYEDGYCISMDADFVITGDIYPDETKPEGPFGDHLGYYSLIHPFPVMHVRKVYAKKDNPVWPFTVVGRPPQEDTSFGELIHELTGTAIPKEIPGVKQVHAVDAAGVHPLLLATGSERYTPYLNTWRPAELLTQANRILGTGQLSLAKYLFIANSNDNPPDVSQVKDFFNHILERIDLKRDLHFFTKTTIDTLDYSGEKINEGSKVIFAASGNPSRHLSASIPDAELPARFRWGKIIQNGIISLAGPPFMDYKQAKQEITDLTEKLIHYNLSELPLIILTEEPEFIASDYSNFLWVTFTRSNPSHDIYGIGEFTDYKHWGSNGPIIIDARKKPHHAPELIMPENIIQAAKSSLN